MSVERRGDNNLSTVQRRGEKRTVLPNRDYTRPDQPERPDVAPLPVPLPSSRPEIKIDPSHYFTQMEIASFEARVQDRVRYFKSNPDAKKAFLKKAEGRFGAAIVILFFVFAFPVIAGVLIPFAILYLFLPSLKPKDRRRTARIRQFAEDAIVAMKLKQVK